MRCMCATMAHNRSTFSATFRELLTHTCDGRRRLVDIRLNVAGVRGCGMGVFARHGSRATGVTISFGERFAASDQFDAIFREGMALVERTAAYLDGPGRKEAKALAGPAAVLYASESMRLTTRLLELASWLMIRRSFKE